MRHLFAAIVVLSTVLGASPASATGRLTVSVGHAPSHLLPGMLAAHLTVTVGGSVPAGGPLTVTTAVPVGLTATGAGGAGWSCAVAATVTCTRDDRPARIPPVRILVDAAEDIPATVTVHTTASAGTQSAVATDTIPARDACAYGWVAGRSVSFAPPFGGVDSGVPNPSLPSGCTLLDRIWAAEPFASHSQFVTTVARATEEFVQSGLLNRRQQRSIVVAAARSDVGTSRDHQIDNTCSNRVALKFDDGTSSFRPRLLQLLREKQVHATFFDNGIRVAANPRIARFQGREGHIQLNHTYVHPHLDQLPAAAIREEILRTRDALVAAGAPETFRGVRPPFADTNAVVKKVLLELGYTEFISEWQVETPDWEPDRTATQISDAIVEQLFPGAIIGLHDGPIDTTSGAATVEAVGLIIDRARELGFCFGVPDETGHVVADRYVSSGRPIPQATNPVPYLLPLAFGDPANIPRPFVRIPSPVHVAATHAPATFQRGETGTLTLTVTNRSAEPTDGAGVTVVDAIPPGLTATAVSGAGWTCVEATCTRTDVLAPQAAYPPITITVAVAADAPAAVENKAAFTGHGGSWTSEATDRIPVS